MVMEVMMVAVVMGVVRVGVMVAVVMAVVIVQFDFGISTTPVAVVELCLEYRKQKRGPKVQLEK